MQLGTDYYPEHWVYPYAGTAEEPESRWERDADLMLAAGISVVRMGEFAWGLYEREEGKHDFEWMRRAMDVMGNAGIKVPKKIIDGALSYIEKSVTPDGGIRYRASGGGSSRGRRAHRGHR